MSLFLLGGINSVQNLYIHYLDINQTLHLCVLEKTFLEGRLFHNCPLRGFHTFLRSIWSRLLPGTGMPE